MTHGSSIPSDGFRASNVQKSTPKIIWQQVNRLALARLGASESPWRGQR